MSDAAAPPQPVTSTDALAAFCARARERDFVTLDTEFMRETTYWPKLCVVQLGLGGSNGSDDAIAIDAIADGLDLEPLWDLLRDESVLKVLHAARQDMEIFWNRMGAFPKPVFDTQVAATVCGFGEQAGYETLVTKLAKGSVDKSSRFTDWSMRPLTDKQVRYALADVTHLRVVYAKLLQLLDKNGRRAWVADEMAGLTDPDTYTWDPERAYQRIKMRNQTPRNLAVLKELAAWREREAQRKDIPRGRMLRDESLVEIATSRPKDAKALARTRGLSEKAANGPMGAAILAAVRAGEATPDADCPEPKAKSNLPRGIGPIADLLKVLLKMRAEEADVAPRLIASSDDIDRIAAFGAKAGVPALSGWRAEMFGDDALNLREGKIALGCRGKTLDIVEIEG
jgi:ribonuclease D